MANITKVPNGPLIKKKGPFKGSTLKTGGVIKKAQDGTTTPSGKTWFQMSPSERKNKQAEIKTKRGREGFNKYMDSIVNSNFEKNAATRGMTVDQLRKANKKPDLTQENIGSAGKSEKSSSKGGAAKSPCKGGICPGLNTKSRNGSMIKRADGSMSKPGLWDNIRANKGSGKKPTKQMLVQEKKIKAKSKK
jgi:hypothetical protein